MVRRFSSVLLVVSDVSRAVEFYRDALLLPVRSHEQGGDFAVLGVDGFEIMLHSDRLDGNAGRFVDEAVGAARGLGCLLQFEADDLDGLYERLVRAGADIVRVPQVEDDPPHELIARDPDGYWLVFAETRRD